MNRRDEILRMFRQRLDGGGGILGVSAGSGIAARQAASSGADFLAVYSSGWFRNAGHASIASMLPLANANDLTLSLVPQVVVHASGLPVVAGICAWDASAPLESRLDRCVELGVAGIQNFPSVRLYPPAFRAALEHEGIGLDQELALIAAAHSRGLLTMAFAFDADEAAVMTAAGADIVVAHLGITTDAVADDAAHDAAASATRSMVAAARAVRPAVIALVHGGPVALPDDVAHLRGLVAGLDGFIAASSVERTPVAGALRAATSAFAGALNPSVGASFAHAGFDVSDRLAPEPAIEIDETSLAQYLRAKDLVGPDEPVTVRPLGGGISNQILRYDTAERHGVLKQSRSRIRVAQDWRCDVRRIYNERDSIALLGTLLGPGAVPTISFEDPENYLFVMSPAPADATLWKADLMSGFVNPTTTERAARTLRRIHARTWNQAAIQERFDSAAMLRQLRIEPYYEATAAAHPELADRILAGAEHILTVKRSLVHGDFVPKNIFTTHDGLLVLDHEIAHFGEPAYDTASCINHLLLKAIHFARRTDARPYLHAAGQFWRVYRSGGNGSETGASNEDTILQLGCLVLARVDSKSPVEYLDEAERDLARELGARLLTGELRSVPQAIGELGQRLAGLPRVAA